MCSLYEEKKKDLMMEQGESIFFICLVMYAIKAWG